METQSSIGIFTGALALIWQRREAALRIAAVPFAILLVYAIGSSRDISGLSPWVFAGLFLWVAALLGFITLPPVRNVLGYFWSACAIWRGVILARLFPIVIFGTAFSAITVLLEITLLTLIYEYTGRDDLIGKGVFA